MNVNRVVAKCDGAIYVFIKANKKISKQTNKLILVISCRYRHWVYAYTKIFQENLFRNKFESILH